MLPKSLRLTRHQFPDTRGLKRASSPHFSVSYGDSPTGGVAVVISKKVARLAVTRHLLKRRIMSVMRPYVYKECILVVHVRSGTMDVSSATLRDELNSLLGSILPKHKKN